MRLLFATAIALLLGTSAGLSAPVVDASAHEAAFLKGDYKAARTGFDTALKTFLEKAPRDGTSHKVYAEAEYLLDRLARLQLHPASTG